MNVIKTMHRKQAVCSSMRWGTSTLYQKIGDELFVPPVKMGARSSAWPSDEIIAIQAAYIAGLPEDDIRKLVIDLITARKTCGVKEAS
jgi:prophage regulatory protein